MRGALPPFSNPRPGAPCSRFALTQFGSQGITFVTPTAPGDWTWLTCQLSPAFSSRQSSASVHAHMSTVPRLISRVVVVVV